jgi:PIN domain nuclease of toxin-antitoxin system
LRLLLDTHTFMWAVLAPERLSGRARDALEDLDNTVWASAVNAWEIAIKRRLGKLALPSDGPERLRVAIDASAFKPLSVTVEHAFAVYDLERHHGDPFDRILIAQALVEGMTLVSHDRQFRRYGVDLLW